MIKICKVHGKITEEQLKIQPHRTECKLCIKEYQRKWAIKNKQKFIESSSRYRKKVTQERSEFLKEICHYPPIIKGEKWVDLVDFEGYYSVSSLGRVRSEHRVVPYIDGRHRTIKERILKKTNGNKKGTNLTVNLSKDSLHKTFQVSHLVMNHFFRDAHDNEVIMHKDKDYTNDSLENLFYQEVFYKKSVTEDQMMIINNEDITLRNKCKVLNCSPSTMYKAKKELS